MKNDNLSELISHWKHIAKFISYPKNDKELDKLIQKLDELLDVVGENESHELMGLIDLISYFIESYESLRYHDEQKKASDIDALLYLMETHKLTQNDLPEIGSQGVVSEILSGKRVLNLTHVVKLSKRFNVDPCTFINENINTRPIEPSNHCASKKSA